MQTKQHMLNYLTEIMEHSHDFSWDSAKGAHAVLMCQMEEGHVHWDETQKTTKIYSCIKRLS